jgi:hypothetical protein
VVLSYVILSGKVIQRDEGPTAREARISHTLGWVGVSYECCSAGRLMYQHLSHQDVARQSVIQGETKKVPRGDLKKFYYYTCITYLVIDYGIEPLLS